MSNSAGRDLIERASKLTDDERCVVVDVIAPKESTSLAEEWENEVARRAALVRSGQVSAKPADQVFDRLESKLRGT